MVREKPEPVGFENVEEATGAARNVMIEGTFPLVILERKTSPNIFVVANGEQIRDLVKRPFHSRQTWEFKNT